MPQTLHYYALKIADLSHGSRAEYFWHFYALPCPITLRHKDVKKTGGVIIWSTDTKLNELNMEMECKSGRLDLELVDTIYMCVSIN